MGFNKCTCGRGQLVRGLERGPERGLCVVVGHEHVREVAEQVDDELPALVEVDQQVGGRGQEHVVHVGDRQLRRLRGAVHQRVEVHRAVVGYQTNLRWGKKAFEFNVTTNTRHTRARS